MNYSSLHNHLTGQTLAGYHDDTICGEGGRGLRGGYFSHQEQHARNNNNGSYAWHLKTSLWSPKTLHEYYFMISHMKFPRVLGRYYQIPILQMRKQRSERSRLCVKSQGWTSVFQFLNSSSSYSIPLLQQIGLDQRSKETKIWTTQREKMGLLFVSWKVRYIWENN